MNKVVFIDRDGTINVNNDDGYVFAEEDFILIDGAAEAIRLLNNNGYKVVVITNQGGIARQLYTDENVIRLHDYLQQLLEAKGAYINAFYYCPHHPLKGSGPLHCQCSCRKPGIGMFLQAEKQFPVNKEASYMIGDSCADMEAGRRYGVHTMLVLTGNGLKTRNEARVSFEYCEKDLLAAVRKILSLKIPNQGGIENE